MDAIKYDERQGLQIHVSGIVQGVGFRPFVYSLAHRYDLNGWVRNSSSGVDIAIDGPGDALRRFMEALTTEAPPLAHIADIESLSTAPNGFTGFRILESRVETGLYQPVSPDLTICPDCLRELFDPADRRYRYPFINCTNCGPRYTIIRDIPYDRPLTTMAGFPLCPACTAEYHDPLDRRFHAQPVACPECGPRLWLERSDGSSYISADSEDPILAARSALQDGLIVAIKGLGGFHLACDANNPDAVSELRRRKLRVDKPFAVMLPSITAVRRHCLVDSAEEELLQSCPRPIVLLARRPDSTIAAAVAPGQSTFGVMLPYTPLHYLLMEQDGDFPDALVMTSGNLSDEPIAYTNEEARERLAELADIFLLHNREIHTRCDDSVMRVGLSCRADQPQMMPIRRSRGYAPFPVKLPRPTRQILAVGGELKNTFCLTRDDYAFLSHHIGDMENYETLRSFEEGVAHMESLFHVKPETITCDLHPDYMATRYAHERAAHEGLHLVEVQHHHAHIASAMAEHKLDGQSPVIGVAFDGTGYGDDGTIWGGEFLIADYAGYERVAHLSYVPLPGGDRAIREPWRMALAHLSAAGLPWDADLPPVQHGRSLGADHLPVLQFQIDSSLNAPPTSSMGRLFDAAAALAGVRPAVNYEAQAAIEFEALVDATETGYYTIDYANGLIDPSLALAELLTDHRSGVTVGRIAARFHNGVAQLVRRVCYDLQHERGLHEVVLSGGVWQNITLLRRTIALLEKDRFNVLTHQLVPSNDGGLALGQAAIAAFGAGAVPLPDKLKKEPQKGEPCA